LPWTAGSAQLEALRRHAGQLLLLYPISTINPCISIKVNVKTQVKSNKVRKARKTKRQLAFNQ
jgi:hypothetical protein